MIIMHGIIGLLQKFIRKLDTVTTSIIVSCPDPTQKVGSGHETRTSLAVARREVRAVCLN